MSKTALRKSLEHKFSKWMIIVYLLCWAVCIPEFIIFDFTEVVTAKYAIIPWIQWPLIIILVLFFLYAFFRVFRIEPKFRKPPIKVFFLRILATILLTIIFYFTCTMAIVCSAQLLNAALGDGREVMVHSTVEEFIRSKHRSANAPETWKVKITDSTTGRTLYVSVDKPYEIGEPFSGKFKVGKFGWLYSR